MLVFLTTAMTQGEPCRDFDELASWCWIMRTILDSGSGLGSDLWQSQTVLPTLLNLSALESLLPSTSMQAHFNLPSSPGEWSLWLRFYFPVSISALGPVASDSFLEDHDPRNMCVQQQVCCCYLQFSGSLFMLTQQTPPPQTWNFSREARGYSSSLETQFPFHPYK